jgi:polysaccharide deacetylase 2 family uncharacterized protein YibQ
MAYQGGVLQGIKYNRAYHVFSCAVFSGMIPVMKKIFTPSNLRLPLILAVASAALFTFSFVQAEDDGQEILDHIYSAVDDSRTPEASQEEAASRTVSDVPINAEVVVDPSSLESAVEAVVEPVVISKDVIEAEVLDAPVEDIGEDVSIDAEPTTEALLDEPADSSADNVTVEELEEIVTEEITEVMTEEPPAEEEIASEPEAITPAKIAIIIDDMGPDRRRGFGIIKLDAPLTLAFLPYAERLPEMTKIAADRGHELMIHMPMEPENSKLDLGGIGLRNDMTQEQWSEELDKAFASFKGYAGLNNHMGSSLTQNQEAMDYVMTRLVEQGLYFVDSKTIASSVANDSAQKAGLKTANRDVFLDHEDNIEFVRDALVKLEETAKRKGHAIAIGHPKDVTIQGLNEWLPTLEAKGIELVHASELVRSYDPVESPAEDKEVEATSKPKLIVEPTIVNEDIKVEDIKVESISAQDREQALKEALSLENPE